jgi:hypothetical protein
MVYEAMVCLVQTMDPSCTDTNTIPKQTETRFYWSLVTEEYHPVHPKQFLYQWYIWRKLSCTKTNTISKWTKSRFYMTRVTLEFHMCVQNQFLRLWYVWYKLWPYLAPTLTLSPNGPTRDSTWPTSPRSSIGCVWIDFRAYGTFGANCSPILNPD